MNLNTPSKIESVAWEGELVAPAISYSTRGRAPKATLGQPEVWPATEVLQSAPLQSEALPNWVPPQGDAEFWLVRLACTLHPPDKPSSLSEAEQRLFLRPQNANAKPDTTYAYSLYPDRLGVEDGSELSVSLAPELTFSGVKVKAGQLGAQIDYRKIFPVVQSYGAGEPTPYWVFKSHPTRPIDGSQYVYAVVAAKAGSEGIRGFVSLTATVDSPFGPQRWGLPETVKDRTRFEIS